ncbi:VOC family protein [Ramlibacter sp. PS4R-6]|uniref:VOC family protein n=1 Tax=Ramlibacter sp. PS4R-6 TaxID=3133438 RepID=UPI00309B1C04
MAYHFGKFAWFEHVSNDAPKARQFYEELLGWKVKAMAPGSYEVIHNGADFIGGVVAGTPHHWRSWLSVADVDDRYRAALAAGAKPAMEPVDYPGIGRGATVLDPTGARVSIWKGLQGDRPDAEHVASGDFDWNELATPDPQKALAFYESVFGYTHMDWDMGPIGMYRVLQDAAGKARGGIMKTEKDGDPAQWVPYVKVENADAIAARVAPLGGTLAQKVLEVPEVGRVGILVDPVGAALGFIQPVVKA